MGIGLKFVRFLGIKGQKINRYIFAIFFISLILSFIYPENHIVGYLFLFSMAAFVTWLVLVFFASAFYKKLTQH